MKRRFPIRIPTGFTLIELILASVIFAIIGTLTASAIWATAKTSQVIDTSSTLQEIGTSAIYKIREDLSQTFHVEAPRPLTFFRGEDRFDLDRIDFTSLSHVSSAAYARESDQAEISYVAESDPDNSQFNVLRRRTMRYLDGQIDPEGEGEFVTLATNLTTFNLEYSDGERFRPEWDIREADQLNKLPRAVRVSLSFRDETGREVYFQTLVELAMTETLSIATPTPTPGANPSPTPQAGQPGQTQPNQPGTTPEAPR